MISTYLLLDITFKYIIGDMHFASVAFINVLYPDV